MLVLFLIMGVVKPDTGILDKKLPVVVAISDCPQKPEMEIALKEEFQKRQMNVITDQTAGELFKDQMKRVKANTNKESISRFPSTKEGMAAFFENQMDQVSNIAQKLYVTTVLNANIELDSCYYFIRSLPEFLPQA